LSSFAVRKLVIEPTSCPLLSLARIGCKVHPGARAKMFEVDPDRETEVDPDRETAGAAC
jgi:hypothetical protein